MRTRFLTGCILALWCACGAFAQTQQVNAFAVGPVPRGVAIDPATNVALVANFGDNTLSVVDLAGEKVIATVQNITSPAGVAVNRATGTAVVANLLNNSVTVLEVATRRILGVVTVGFNPLGVAVNPLTNVAVVANSNGNSVSLVDLAALREVAQVDGISNATGIQSVAVDPDLNVAVVASSTSNSVFVVDLATRKIRKQIQVEQSPSGVAIEPLTKTAVVTNLNSNSVSLIDLTTNTVRATVSTIPIPQAVAVASGSLSALVTTNGNGTIELVNLATATVQASIPNLPNAAAVAFNENTGRAAVVLPNTNSLAIVRFLGLFTTVNAASFLRSPSAPSSIASGFGLSLAPGTGSAGTVPLPTSLNTVSVRVGNILSPLFYVSSGQINFQVPRLSPGSYLVEIFNGTQRVTTGGLVVVAGAPALFTVNQQGTGQAAALNEDNTPNGTRPPAGSTDTSGRKPARAGGVIQLFGTGGGALNPDPAAGSAATTAAPTVLTATAQIGGLTATVLYSGASPGLVGVWQVNVAIPLTVSVGSAVPVIVTLNGRPSNPVTIAVE